MGCWFIEDIGEWVCFNLALTAFQGIKIKMFFFFCRRKAWQIICYIDTKHLFASKDKMEYLNLQIINNVFCNVSNIILRECY